MNTSILNNVFADKIVFDQNNMSVTLTDGRTISTPLAYFPRLLNATNEQRNAYIISGGGTGLHWEELDEDISVKNLILGIGDRTNPITNIKQET